MNRKELEIMAPAGGFDCLRAAIQGGADSVYFGIGRLNMRSRSAANFLPEDLPEVVRICREAGVRSYLTLNITLFQGDLADMRETLDAARAAGVDAVIASDIAAIQYCRQIGLEVHEIPWLKRNSPDIAFQPGMVFAMEPKIFIPNEIYMRVEDMVLVTEDGARSLTTFDRELFKL